MNERSRSQDDERDERARGESRPDSTGPNARPRHETIAQTGPGIPDDTSAPVEISPEEEKRIEKGIRSL